MVSVIGDDEVLSASDSYLDSSIIKSQERVTIEQADKQAVNLTLK
mgnify:CR=1 FL=1